MRTSTAAALVGAGVLSVLIYPSLALNLVRDRGPSESATCATVPLRRARRVRREDRGVEPRELLPEGGVPLRRRAASRSSSTARSRRATCSEFAP